MTQQMLNFVSIETQRPKKRPAARRRRDFTEIYHGFDTDAAAEQASRCSQCGIPFCQVHCPLSNNIPDWLQLTAEGRVEEAYELSSATNNLPEICGRICPHDRLCEGNCVIEQSGHGTVTIGSVETFITETAWANGWVLPPAPLHERPESVGIIGAGPAGLAAAEQLRHKGYRVFVYDRYDRVGGLLIYGIPSFKLEKHLVERRADLLRRGKVEFVLDFEIGRDSTFAELRARHDVLLVASGTYQARNIPVPGVGLGGVVEALDYLIASNRKSLDDYVLDDDLDANCKNVVVVGGGDTAMDCVRTAVRQGAASVKCLYRRDRDNMPGSQREVAHAEEEGVEFVWLSAPQAFLGDDNTNKVCSVRTQRMHLGSPDATGRQVPEPIEGSNYVIDADLVIKAFGFDPEDLPTLWGEPTLPVSSWGTLRVDHRTMMTDMDGVFAAGDIVRGASLVVWAIRDGRDAAAGIHQHLTEQSAKNAVAAE
jgi:glutamate synthase (NADPH/NADH) small chain